jgi:hypothetical protein
MDIVSTIVTAITEIISGSASAISDGVVALLLETDTSGVVTGLSNTGIIIFTLFGLGMGVGLMYVIFNLVTRR